MAYSANDLTPAQRKTAQEMLRSGNRAGAAAFVQSSIAAMKANKAQNAQNASGLSGFQKTQVQKTPNQPITGGVMGRTNASPGMQAPSVNRKIQGTGVVSPVLTEPQKTGAPTISVPTAVNSDQAAMNQANQEYANAMASSADEKNRAAAENANRLAALIAQQNAAKSGNADVLQGIVDSYSGTAQTNYDTAVANANKLLDASVANQGVQALVAQSGENMRGASEGSKLDVGRTAAQNFDMNVQGAMNTANQAINAAGTDKLTAQYNQYTLQDKVRQLKDAMTDAQYKALTDAVIAQGGNQKAALDLVEQAYAKSFGAIADAATNANVFTFRNNSFETKWNTSDGPTRYSMIAASFADNPEGAIAALDAFKKNPNIGYSELQAIANAKGGELKHKNELETAYASRGEGLQGTMAPAIATTMGSAAKVETQSPITKADKANYDRVVKNLANYFKMSQNKRSEYHDVFKTLDGIRKRFDYETKSPAERKAMDDFVRQKLPRLLNTV